jgi:hypothetical protein
MTVAELIEKLRELPGDNDLRAVICEIEAHRPYANPAKFEAQIQSLTVDLGVARIRAWGWCE